MNRVRLAAALGIGVLVGAVGFVACSSSDSSSPPAGGNKNDGSTNPAPDGGSGGDDSGNGNAGYDSWAPDPGYVGCNGSACGTTPDNYCCITDAGQSCTSMACSSGLAELHCDEKADCPTGTSQVCCGTLSGTGITVVCADTCPGNLTQTQYQVCKTDAECPTNVVCKPQICAGAHVRTCGGITNPQAGCTDG